MNDKILCAFPIFAPTRSLFRRNLNSINSFIDYLKTEPLRDKLDIIYAGYVYNDFHWETIRNLINDNIPNAKVFRLDKNYGKSFICNKIIADYYEENPETQLMFTMDSDIKFDITQKDFFGRLAVCADMVSKQTNGKFGLLAPAQTEANCHWIDSHMNQSAKYKIMPQNMEEEIVWSDKNQGGIAGGALLLNLKIFASFGFYKMFNNCYSGEDAQVELDFRMRGFTTQILKTLSVIHPTPDDNEDYVNWKKESIKGFNEPFNIDVYNENVMSSMKFWDEQNKKEI